MRFLMAGLLLGPAAVALAGTAEGKIEQMRYLPAFLSSDERRDREWWLDLTYEVSIGISTSELNQYAEMRARQMCGGDFRYLSFDEKARDRAEPGEVSYRIDVIVECIHDEAGPEVP